jgi:hypothetical protein
VVWFGVAGHFLGPRAGEVVCVSAVAGAPTRVDGAGGGGVACRGSEATGSSALVKSPPAPVADTPHSQRQRCATVQFLSTIKYVQGVLPVL